MISAKVGRFRNDDVITYPMHSLSRCRYRQSKTISKIIEAIAQKICSTNANIKETIPILEPSSKAAFEARPLMTNASKAGISIIIIDIDIAVNFFIKVASFVYILHKSSPTVN